MSINLSGRFWDWRTDLARDDPGTSSSSPASPAPSTPTPTSRRGRGGGSSPPRRRTLSALFSLARGESNDDNEVNRLTISRPILNHGPIPMPGNGEFVYVHPSRPRLDVEIPRSSFSASELWEGSGVERASEGRRSIEEEIGGAGSVTDLDDGGEETMLVAAALPGARSTEEVADLDATYLLPFVSSTPAPSFSSSSATLVPSPAPSVHVHFADDVPQQDGGLQREQSARWLHHPLRQHPPPPNSAPVVVVAARTRAPSPHPNIIGQRDGTPPPGPDRPRGKKKKKQRKGLCCGLFGQEEEDESEELEMAVLGQGEGGEEFNGSGRQQQQQQQQQRRSVRDSWVTVSRWTE